MTALQTSNNHVEPRYYILVVAWLSATIAVFIYLTQQRLVVFDPHHQLLNTSSKIILDQLPELPARSVVHFYDNRCSCTNRTRTHQAAINKLATAQGFTVVNIKLSDNAIAPSIPAVPAIAIVGDNNDLLYAGPYATGLDCSENNSLVDVVLHNFAQGFSTPTIISDARGCYCQRKTQR